MHDGLAQNAGFSDTYFVQQEIKQIVFLSYKIYNNKKKRIKMNMFYE